MADDPDNPIRTKHVLEPRAPTDGRRLLIERNWAERLKHDAIEVDDVLERLAPSEALRAWEDRETEKFDEFSLKYRLELAGADEELDKLLDQAERGPITLLHAAEKSAKSHVHVLAELLRERLAARRRSGPRSGASAPGGSPRAP
jgi:uncharacterized protein YeaO (DUF488 family)